MRLVIFAPESCRMLESETLGLRHSTVRFSGGIGPEDSERAERGPLLSACGRPGLLTVDAAWAAELKQSVTILLGSWPKHPKFHSNDLHRSFVFIVQAPIH